VQKENPLGQLLTLALMMPQMRRQQQEARQTRAAREAVLKLLGTPQHGPPQQVVREPQEPGTLAAAVAAPMRKTAWLPEAAEAGSGLLGLGSGGTATPGQVGPGGQGMGGPAVAPGAVSRGPSAGMVALLAGAPGLGPRKSLDAGALTDVLSRTSTAPGRTLGLDEVLGSEEFRRAAAVAAAHGMPEFAGMRPVGWTPSREEQQGAFRWGDLGGREEFTQGQLTRRAELGANTRVQIAEMRERGRLPEALRMRLQMGSQNGRAMLAAADRERAAGDRLYEQMQIDGIDRSDVIEQHYEKAAQREEAASLFLYETPAAGSGGQSLGSGTAGGGGTAALPTTAPATVQTGARPTAPLGTGPNGKPLPIQRWLGEGKVTPMTTPTPRIAPPVKSRMQVQQDMRVQLEHVRAGLKKANSPNATQGEKIKAAGEALSAFFGLAPEEARGLAALSPSMQVQALKQRGLIAESDDRDVMALTRTILSRMRLRSEVAKDPQKMKEVVTNASGVAQELISSWRQKPTGGAGGGQAQTASGRDLASMGPMKFVQQYRAKGISDEQLRVALAAARVSKAKIDQALGQGRPAQVAQR